MFLLVLDIDTPFLRYYVYVNTNLTAGFFKNKCGISAGIVTGIVSKRDVEFSLLSVNLLVDSSVTVAVFPAGFS